MAISPGSSNNELSVRINGDSSGLNEAVEGGKDSLLSLRGAVGATSAALSALAVGGLAASVSEASKFQTAMVDLEKVTNPETAEEMGSAIREMSGTMPLAQTELAGIAEQAGRLGVSGTENITTFTETTAEMATATDLNAEQAADSFARMSTLMGEPIENVRQIGDSVNALSNNMATSASEITDAATRSSGALTNLGASSEQVLALNATMNTVSSSSRIAGTRIRRFSQELMNPSKIGDLSSALGMTAEEFRSMRNNSPVELMKLMARRMNEGGDAARGLRKNLGTTSRQALASLGQNLDGLNTALETSKTQFEEGGSLAKEFETASQTFTNQLQLLKNELTNVAITIGQVLLPPLTDLVQWLTDVVGSFQDFNESTDGMAGALGLIGTAIGGAVLAFQQLLPLMTGGTTATMALSMAVRTLLGPIGLAITAIGALGTAFATDFAGIRTQTMRVAGVLKTELLGAFNSLRTTVMPIVRQIAGAWNGRMDRVTSVASGLAEELGTHLIGRIQALGQITQRITARIDSLWQRHGGAVLSIINDISGHLSEGLIQAMAAVRSALHGDTQQMRHYISEFRRHFATAFGRLAGVARRGLTMAFDWIRTKGVSLARSALSFLATQAATAFAFGRNHILPVVRSALTMAWTWVRTTGVSLARSALSFLARQAGVAFSLFETHILPHIQRALRGAWTWVRTTGVQLARTALSFLVTQAANAWSLIETRVLPHIQRAIRGAWNWVRTTGVSLARTALSFLVTQATNAWSFIQQRIVPVIGRAIRGVVSWIRGPGVTLARQALSFLVTQAANAWSFIQQRVVPVIQRAIRGVVSWIRGPGVSLAKQAFSFLVTQAGNAWSFIQQRVVPAIRQAINAAMQWVRNVGVPLAKSALSWLATQAMNAWDVIQQNAPRIINDAVSAAVTWVRESGVPLVKSGLSWLVTQAMNAWDAIQPKLKTIIKDGIGAVQTWLRESATGNIRGAFQAIGTVIRGVVGGLFKLASGGGGGGDGGGQSLGGIIKGFMGDLVGYLKNEAYDDLASAASFLMDSVAAAATGLYQGLIGNPDATINSMIGSIVSYLKNDAVSDLKTAGTVLFGALVDTGNWLKDVIWDNDDSIIKSLIGSVSSYLKNDAKDDLKGAFEAIAEGAIAGFNGIMPDQFGIPEVTLPEVSFTIPGLNLAGHQVYEEESVAVGPFGPFGGGSVPVPQLAAGGIVPDPTLSMIGEAGTEVVMPLDKLDTMLSTAATTPAAASGGSPTYHVTVEQSVAEEGIHVDARDEGLDEQGVADAVSDELDQREQDARRQLKRERPDLFQALFGA